MYSVVSIPVRIPDILIAKFKFGGLNLRLYDVGA